MKEKPVRVSAKVDILIKYLHYSHLVGLKNAKWPFEVQSETAITQECIITIFIGSQLQTKQ